MIANFLECRSKTCEILLQPLDLVGCFLRDCDIGALALTFAAEFGDDFITHNQQLSLADSRR